MPIATASSPNPSTWSPPIATTRKRSWRRRAGADSAGREAMLRAGADSACGEDILRALVSVGARDGFRELWGDDRLEEREQRGIERAAQRDGSGRGRRGLPAAVLEFERGGRSAGRGQQLSRRAQRDGRAVAAEHAERAGRFRAGGNGRAAGAGRARADCELLAHGNPPVDARRETRGE